MTDLNECEGCRVQGLCCHLSMPHGDGLTIFSRIPCAYLDLDTKTCTRWDTRHEVPWCGSSGQPGVIFPNGCVPHHADGTHGITMSDVAKVSNTDRALARECAQDFDDQVLAYYKERWPEYDYLA